MARATSVTLRLQQLGESPFSVKLIVAPVTRIERAHFVDEDDELPTPSSQAAVELTCTVPVCINTVYVVIPCTYNAGDEV